MNTKGMRIGILTAGGDCPGLNAAIRGVGKTAIVNYGMKVYGIASGFRGLIDKEYTEFHEDQLSGILTLGGTILGTSREKPYKNNGDSINKPELIKSSYKELKLDCLVCIGGNGTQKTAAKLAKEGLNIIGIPKTIDNDVWGTEVSFGFHSALDIASDAIDRLHTTANSHGRVMVIEVMGHHAGWIALYAGIASGGDVILIPEVPYEEQVIADYLLMRKKQKKDYSIVVVAEGVDSKKKKSAGKYIAKQIQKLTGIETRETILGYIQRGGSPSAYDRILATRYGAFASELISKEHFGSMVAMNCDKLKAVPLDQVKNMLKLVEAGHPLIKKGRALGTCFGDCKGSI